MTASLSGILVERGLLSWDSSLKDMFPDLFMHPDYETVTLKQLLSHTAGTPAFTDPGEESDDLMQLLNVYEGSAMRHRLDEVLPAVLAQQPRVQPGTEFVYSNMGYIVVGAMLETLTRTPFETLLEQEYFAPLGITSGGFGAPGTFGQVSQPYGHAPEPIEPGPEADNPISFSPAGRAHMSVLDFAKHLSFHLTGKPEIVSRETLEQLHIPVRDDYALGWGSRELPWAGGRALQHAGSNGRSFALTGIAPAKKKAIACASNVRPDQGEKACIEVFKALVKRYL